jgi:hypothetical protein
VTRLVPRVAARRGRGEEGASLVIAMAFIVLFSLVLTAVLAFSTTSFQSQATIADNARAARAASAGIDTAVARIRNDPAMLLGGPSACSGVLMNYNPTDSTPSSSVGCTAVPATDAVQPGVGGPANALLTLGAGGITSSGSGVVKTTGNVFSNSGITLNGAGVLDATDYAVTATGACGTSVPNADSSASISPWLAVTTQCNAAATVPQYGDGADPRAADNRFLSRMADVPLTYNATPTCTGRTLTFSPGRYTDPTWFATTKWPAVVCGAGTLPTSIYFSPGAYYFDFGAGGESTTWTLTNISVIGGARSAAYNGNAQPSFPTNMQDGTNPVNCQTESGNGAATGLQFILGGASQMVLGSQAKVELCPKVDTNGFGVAVLGLNSGDPGVVGGSSGSKTLVPRTAVAPVGTTAQIASCTQGTASSTQIAMQNPVATFPASVTAPSAVTSPIDTVTASAGGPTVSSNPPPVPVGGTASVELCGFDWNGTVGVPPGSTVNGVSLDIAHYELPCLSGSQNDGPNGTGVCKSTPDLVDENPFEHLGGEVGLPDCDIDDPCVNASITATVSTSIGNCTVTIANRVTLGTDPFAACINTGPGGLINSATPTDANFASSIKISYQVRVNSLPVAQAFLDGIVVHLDYTTPATHAGSGCVVALSCAALSSVNAGPINAPVFANWGTAYFPSAAVNLDFSGSTKIAFDRGLIASSVTLTNLPATDTKGRFRLSTGSGRTVILTAQSGNQKVYARVRIVDSQTASPHGFAVAVREWSTAP